MAAAATMVDVENVPMFCYQCEQTAKGEGCTVRGVCQKDAEVAGLQDFLVRAAQAVCAVANVLYTTGRASDVPAEVERFVPMAFFATLTNVNFDPDDIVSLAQTAARLRGELLAKLQADQAAALPELTREWRLPEPAATRESLAKAARELLIPRRMARLGKDRVALQELLMYGVKGVAAYAFHAIELGTKCSDVVADICRYMGDVVQRPDPSVEELLAAVLDCGKTNLRTMELLDQANTGHYGDPEPTRVQWIQDAADGSEKPGKAILVSGHDLLELEHVLKAAQEKGIMVYTHGEMLPCNAYPKLKANPNLAGHYGTAWQNQKKEFAAFPGPILMTTNCYIPAPDSYVHRVFSCEPVSGINVQRIRNHDFTALIDAALAMQGFGPKTGPAAGSGRLDHLTIGFARKTILGAAGTVVDAVKTGKLGRIFLIGGCDGFERERNQFTDIAEKLPDNTLILTLACGKFKVNMREYGTLADTGLPRLLDCGQCNDAYTALVVATELAKVFNCSVNELPLSLIVSWFEQKAVAILLTLLHLGIQNVWVGPRLPAFFTPAILDVLVNKFHIHHFTNADVALEAIYGKKQQQ